MDLLEDFQINIVELSKIRCKRIGKKEIGDRERSRRLIVVGLNGSTTGEETYASFFLFLFFLPGVAEGRLRCFREN